jgi:hypothetical protein
MIIINDDHIESGCDHIELVNIVTPAITSMRGFRSKTKVVTCSGVLLKNANPMIDDKERAPPDHIEV